MLFEVQWTIKPKFNFLKVKNAHKNNAIIFNHSVKSCAFDRSRKIKFIFAISSNCKDYKGRQKIRATWGNKTLAKRMTIDVDIHLMFTVNSTCVSEVAENDVLFPQEGTYDIEILLFDYIARFCKNSTHLYRGYSTEFLSQHRLFKEIRGLQTNKRFMLGEVVNSMYLGERVNNECNMGLRPRHFKHIQFFSNLRYVCSTSLAIAIHNLIRQSLIAKSAIDIHSCESFYSAQLQKKFGNIFRDSPYFTPHEKYKKQPCYLFRTIVHSSESQIWPTYLLQHKFCQSIRYTWKKFKKTVMEGKQLFTEIFSSFHKFDQKLSNLKLKCLSHPFCSGLTMMDKSTSNDQISFSISGIAPNPTFRENIKNATAWKLMPPSAIDVYIEGKLTQLSQTWRYPVENVGKFICRGNEVGTDVLVHLIFAIKSICKNEDRRSIIRQTWGNISMLNMINKSVNVELVFLMGSCPTQNQSKLDEEIVQYGDILQWRFDDTFQVHFFCVCASSTFFSMTKCIDLSIKYI